MYHTDTSVLWPTAKHKQGDRKKRPYLIVERYVDLTRLSSRFLIGERVVVKRSAVSHFKQTRNSPEKGTRRPFDRNGIREDTRRAGIGFRSVHCALKNLHKYIPWPLYPGAGCATAEQVRSPRQWRYSLSAGKHLPGL